ncbi:MAG: dihydrodipicolinate synthase family protein [Acidimicrobiales bacterium]
MDPSPSTAPTSLARPADRTAPELARDLRGLWVPIVTPFDDGGRVDVVALERLAGRLLADGVTGLVALGTTGEPATLDPAERRLVVEVCDRACVAAGRRLIVGAATSSTATTIDEVERLTSGTSAVAALVMVPPHTRPSAAGVVAHFAAVADTSPVPIVAYHVPYRTGLPLDAAALLAVADHPRVVGIKQSVGALDVDTLELLARARPGFQVLAGDDAFIVPTILLGGAGAIAASSHLCTPMFVDVVAAALAGDHRRAVALAEALLPVVTIGFREPSPSGWKGALARRGELASASLRAPMTAASDEVIDALVIAAGRAKDAVALEPQPASAA